MPSYQKHYTKNNTSIHIIQTGEEEWTVRLRSPNKDTFNDLVSELKETVPSSQREYDPTIKAWRIFNRDLLDQWLEFARDLGAKVEWTDENTFHQSRSREMSSSDAYKTLCLTPNAPREVIRASYKALATIFHPDKPEGDIERMKSINGAYDLLMRGDNSHVS